MSKLLQSELISAWPDHLPLRAELLKRAERELKSAAAADKGAAAEAVLAAAAEVRSPCSHSVAGSACRCCRGA